MTTISPELANHIAVLLRNEGHDTYADNLLKSLEPKTTRSFEIDYDTRYGEFEEPETEPCTASSPEEAVSDLVRDLKTESGRDILFDIDRESGRVTFKSDSSEMETEGGRGFWEDQSHERFFCDFRIKDVTKSACPFCDTVSK